MRRLTALLCLIVVCAWAQTADQLLSAHDIWERAIRAKGGRDRLNAVQNVLTVRRSRTRLASVCLHVFPDKYWEYLDQRPTVFGISISVGDERGQWRDYTTGGRQGGRPVWSDADPLLLRNVVGTQAGLLLESRWHKPKLTELHTERIGRDEYHVVTTEFGAYRMTYYIDKTTSLVRRVRNLSKMPLLMIADYWNLLDYRSVDGLQMPSRIAAVSGLVGNWKEDLEFQFNVDYDPDLFLRKAYVQDGPDGWKRKK